MDHTRQHLFSESSREEARSSPSTWRSTFFPSGYRAFDEYLLCASSVHSRYLTAAVSKVAHPGLEQADDDVIRQG